MARDVTAAGRPGTTPFSAATMKAAATVNNLGMPYTATRLVLSETADSGGDVTDSFVPDGTFPCRIAPISKMAARLPEAGGQRINEDATHFITCPESVVINSQDRVSLNGVSFTILTITTYGVEESAKRLEVRAI